MDTPPARTQEHPPLCSSSSPVEPRLRDFLRELANGGVVLTYPLAALPGIDHEDDAQVAFRTLVQLDGDICLSVHARALASPGFEAAYTLHRSRVHKALQRRAIKVRRSVRGIGWAAGLLGGGLTLTSGTGAELVDRIAPVAYAELLELAVAIAVGFALSGLGRLLVRRLLRP